MSTMLDLDPSTHLKEKEHLNEEKMPKEEENFNQEELLQFFLKEIKFLMKNGKLNNKTLFDERLKSLPSSVVESLMNQIIQLSSKEIEHPNVGKFALDLLLNPKTRTIIMRDYSQPFTFPILRALLRQSNDVEVLDLTGFKVWSVDKYNNTIWKQLLATLITRLNKLKILHAGLVVSDAHILNLIFTHCPDLTELTLCGDIFYDNKHNMKNMPCMKNLLRLNLGISKFDKNLEVVVNILKNCPNLQFLDYPFIGHAIDKLDGGYLLALTELNDKYTIKKHLNSIIEKCPNLVSITLNNPQYDILPGLAKLSNLKYIELKNFKFSDIYYTLEKMGSQIRGLTLIQTEKVDIGLLLQFTPNLEFLKVLDVSRVSCNPRQKLNCSLLSQLVMRGDFMTMSPSMHQILYETPAMRHFELSNWQELNHENIVKLIELGMWTKLEYFELWNTQLTRKSLELILEHCTELKKMVGVSTWDLDLQLINHKIKKINHSCRIE